MILTVYVNVWNNEVNSFIFIVSLWLLLFRRSHILFFTHSAITCLDLIKTKSQKWAPKIQFNWHSKIFIKQKKQRCKIIIHYDGILLVIVLQGVRKVRFLWAFKYSIHNCFLSISIKHTECWPSLCFWSFGWYFVCPLRSC